MRYDSGGALLGSVLYRRGQHSVQVGPLTARDDATAQALLQAVFSDLVTVAEPFPAVLTVPMNNSGILRILSAYGLSVNPRLTRMSRGRKRLHAREDRIYALSGPEKG